MGKSIIIAGGSGMIGRALTGLLVNEGHNVSWLSHSGSKGPVPVHHWNPGEGKMPTTEIRSSDVLVNLAGAGIADSRWTSSRKKVLRDSRVEGNRQLAKILSEDKGDLKAYISSAAMGIYGDRGSDWCSEDDLIQGDDFLIEICKEWEQSIDQVEKVGLRTVAFRISVVLSMEGGALPKIASPMNFGVANYFGNGEQYYSWIHIEDLIGMFFMAINSDMMQGTYNAASPKPMKMHSWIKELASVHPRHPWVFGVPAFGLRLAFGEMADVLLNSVRLDVEKIRNTSFEYKFPDLKSAGKSLLGN